MVNIGETKKGLKDIVKQYKEDRKRNSVYKHRQEMERETLMEETNFRTRKLNIRKMERDKKDKGRRIEL